MVEKLNPLIRLLNGCGDAHWDFAVAMLVQVSVLVAVLLCLDWLLRRRVRAVFRYAMWTLVLVKLVLPVSLHCPASVAYWLADYRPVVFDPGPSFADATADRTVTITPAATPARPRLPFDQVPTGPWGSVSGTLPAPVDSGDSGGTAAGLESSASWTPAPVQLQRVRWTAWLFCGWLATVVVLLGILARRTVKVHRLVERASPAPADLQKLLDESCVLVQLRRRNVELRVSDELHSPAICGLWKPTILLPRALLNKLDRRQMRMVFVHELVHWKRYDVHVNCLQAVLQIVYFYNPVVWIANAILRRLREQAVDETVLVSLGSEKDGYTAALLDTASAFVLRPAELSLRLVGVLESRKALAGRIRRILARPIPKTAKLGLAGLAVILLLGTLLLPMAGSGRSAAAADDGESVAASPASSARSSASPASDQATSSRAQTEPESESTAVQKEPVAPRGVLSGRITDDTGAPVTDAEIEITDSYFRGRLKAKTDEQGHYHFEEVKEPGEYQIQIKSGRWVGITRFNELPRIHLTPPSQVVRDFTLSRACRLRIETVDQEGKPVSNVRVYTALLSDEKYRNAESLSTDKQGWALIGGLKPSESNYVIGTWSKDYGFGKLVIKLDDPEEIVSRQIVLDKGVEVKGTAVCSDGKPPAGWRITAMPTWWHFGASPMGQVIGPDGSFTLPHVVPDKYDVTISVPSNVGGGSSPKTVLSSAALPTAEGPLAVTLDYPSPGSMASISGRIRYVGGAVKRGFWVFANSEDRQYHGSVYLKPGEEEFRIEPIPRGIYNVQFESTEIESKVLRGIAAPAENLEVEITVSGRPALRGAVVRGDTGEPVTDFRVRITKARTLRGPNYVQEPRWHEVKDTQGQFEIEVVGPGIYVVQVAADGFAWASSEPINTDEDADKQLRLELNKGVSLSGTVFNEQGSPVDGATVTALSKASGLMPSGPSSVLPENLPQSVILRLFTTENGAVKTVDGRFTIDGLTPGKDTLKVTHPDYCFTIVQNVEVGRQARADELKITLTRGGTVRGHVYDEEGKPEPNVTLYFQNREGYSGPPDENTGRFATAVTDENGYYEAHGLPDELCYVHWAEEWDSLGVVRQAILPQNGKTYTLDFGGQAKLTGRLLLNGAPLSGAKLLLAGESPNFGIFRAYARTGSDGSFAFSGMQPGKRTLYYAVPGRRDMDWGRVRDVLVTSQAADLGTIDHTTVRVVVRCVSEDVYRREDMRVYLEEYDPIWPFGNRVGALLSRKSALDPFVFEQVPVGKYELVYYQPGHFQVRQMVEVTGAGPEQEVTCELPVGTALLSGRIDGAICGPGGCSKLNVWSKDQRLLGYIVPKEDGTYLLDNIPAGDYVIREKDTRDAEALVELSLKDQESKTLDLTADVVSPSTPPIGFLMVRIFTSEGVPLPCDVRIEGPGGTLSPHSSQFGQQGFVGAPGTYELSVAYPGFESLRRTVELMPVGKDGRAAKGSEVRFHLPPSEG